MAPPMAINCKWRLESLRCNSWGDDDASSLEELYSYSVPFSHQALAHLIGLLPEILIADAVSFNGLNDQARCAYKIKLGDIKI